MNPPWVKKMLSCNDRLQCIWSLLFNSRFQCRMLDFTYSLRTLRVLKQVHYNPYTSDIESLMYHQAIRRSYQANQQVCIVCDFIDKRWPKVAFENSGTWILSHKSKVFYLEIFITAPRTRKVGTGAIYWCFYQHLYTHNLTYLLRKLPCLMIQCFSI